MARFPFSEADAHRGGSLRGLDFFRSERVSSRFLRKATTLSAYAYHAPGSLPLLKYHVLRARTHADLNSIGSRFQIWTRPLLSRFHGKTARVVRMYVIPRVLSPLRSEGKYHVFACVRRKTPRSGRLYAILLALFPLRSITSLRVAHAYACPSQSHRLFQNLTRVLALSPRYGSVS